MQQFDSQALLCSDAAVVPVQIIEWFVLRWQIEVTFQEALLGLFSWITLAAHLLGNRQLATPRSAAWYAKSEPTFVDAIALVRRQMWIASETFYTSPQKPDMQQIPTPLFNRFIESLTYAV